MKLLKLKVVIAITFVICLTAGCASVHPTFEPDPRVTIIDSSLSSCIAITDVISKINQSGLMEIQVNGVNKTSFYKKPEYKVEWLDGKGFVIKTILSRWTGFPVYKKSDFSFKAVAPTPKATDYRILIREKDGNNGKRKKPQNNR